MYKGASDKAQDGARRLKLGELAHGEQELTDEQRRDSLKARVRAIETELAILPKKSAYRRQLCLEKNETIEQMRAIRPKKSARGVAPYFIDVIRESVTKAQFNIYMATAVARMEAERAIDEAEQQSPEDC